MILDYRLILAPRWVPIVVEQNKQATNINVGTIINTNKIRKEREKERENTKEFVYPVRSNTDQVWG